MAFQASGTSGEVRKGYQVAVRLGSWSLSDGRLEAQASEIQDVWLDMPGQVDLWLRMGRTFWVWSNVDVADRGQPFVIRVGGSPQVRGAPSAT